MNNRHAKISFFYVLFILLISLSLSFSISEFLYKVPATKKLEFFISSQYVNTDYFNDKLSVIDNVEKINIIPRSIENKYYNEAFQTVGMFSDLLIIPEKLINDEDKAFSYFPIEFKYFIENKITYSSFDLIVYKNVCYGIVIYDKEKNINLFKDYIQFETNERYVLCIGKSTPNRYIKPANKKQTSNAIKAFLELIKDFD